MKVYKKEPKTEVIIVETDTHCYEFFMIVPVSLGTAEWTGTQRVIADGHQFTNLTSAQRYFLDMHGENELMKKTRLRIKTQNIKKPAAPKVMTVTTRQLVEKGIWFKFAEAKKIPVTALSQLDKKYEVTETEFKKWGLA